MGNNLHNTVHPTSWGTICIASEKAGEELGNEATTREEPKNESLTRHVDALLSKLPSADRHLASASRNFASLEFQVSSPGGNKSVTCLTCMTLEMKYHR